MKAVAWFVGFVVFVLILNQIFGPTEIHFQNGKDECFWIEDMERLAMCQNGEDDVYFLPLTDEKYEWLQEQLTLAER